MHDKFFVLASHLMHLVYSSVCKAPVHPVFECLSCTFPVALATVTDRLTDSSLISLLLRP